jgi:hypothetical protein
MLSEKRAIMIQLKNILRKTNVFTDNGIIESPGYRSSYCFTPEEIDVKKGLDVVK